MYCIGVFLDLKKAFDVCSHSILLKKLSKMGIQGTAHKWFESYLRDRSQCVDIGGTFSTFRDLAISVIQGSTLGPILFLCYINDFWSATSLFSVLFADDTTGLARGRVLRELTAYVNDELQKISLWYRANKMAVNTSKTKFIVFRTHGKQIDPSDCEIFYNANDFGSPVDQNLIWPIERVYNDGNEKSFKLLGVYFDEYLSFEPHIKHLCAKVSKSLYCINKIKNFIDAPSLKKLYFAMIHSSLIYCINVYGSANKTTLNPLILKQKQAIRTISNAGYRDHTGPLFSELKILPIDQLIYYSKLKFMHSYVFNKLPFSFNETWLTNRMRHPDRPLRNDEELFVPPCRIELVRKLPLVSFPMAWNTETSSEKSNPIQHVFLKQVKRSLLLNVLLE
jgi:hypothetical protein